MSFFSLALSLFLSKSIKIYPNLCTIQFSTTQSRMLNPGWHGVVWLNHSKQKGLPFWKVNSERKVLTTYLQTRSPLRSLLSCCSACYTMWEGPATFIPQHSNNNNNKKNAAIGFRSHIYRVCMMNTAMTFLTALLHPSSSNNNRRGVKWITILINNAEMPARGSHLSLYAICLLWTC